MENNNKDEYTLQQKVLKIKKGKDIFLPLNKSLTSVQRHIVTLCSGIYKSRGIGKNYAIHPWKRVGHQNNRCINYRAHEISDN